MSCFADGIRDVSEFISGIFTDEESTAKAKGPSPQRPEEPQQPLLQNPDNPLDTGKDDHLPCEKKLLNAYFAEKTTIRVRASGSEKNSSASYVVKKGDTLSKIASKYQGVTYKNIAKKNHISAPKYAIAVGQRLFIPNQIATKEKTVYKKITKASLGAKVFLVVKTKGYNKGETLSIELYEKNALLVAAQTPLPFLKERTQQTKVMVHISIDPDDGSEQAVVAIALRPKIDKKEDDKARAGSLEAWREKFKKGEKDKEEKKDYLWLKVTSLVGKGEEKAFLQGSELEVGSCISLNKAKEIAWKVSGLFEGHKPSYSTLSGNFDGQGMSWGLIQWNFGQNTLGPLLKKMKTKDIAKFNACFSDQTDLKNLNTALNSTSEKQKQWAINIQKNHNQRWKNIFNNLANVPEFQKIQIEGLEKYSEATKKKILWMRKQYPDLMKQVELKTFVALFDLSVQQGSISKAIPNILEKCKINPPSTQLEFVTIVVTERGKKAGSRWRADCQSRRLGILQKSKKKVTDSGYTSERSNKNFNLIRDGFVCEI